MSATTPALVAAAAGVGLGHAILPDHWVPLGVLSRTHRYPLGRVARLAGLAGVAHVLVSVAIGAVIVIVGLQLRSTVEHVQNAIVGGLLIVTGLAFGVMEATGHGHAHAHPTTMATATRATMTARTTTMTTSSRSPAGEEPSWCRSARRPPRT